MIRLKMTTTASVWSEINFCVHPSLHFRKGENKSLRCRDFQLEGRKDVHRCATKRCRISRHTMVAHGELKKRSWKCMERCGACCKLGDYDEDVLREMLKTEEDVVEYIDMIGENGWCKWFDSFTRTCMKYDERPRFCRATPAIFQDLYGVDPEEFDEFAISCCEFHIENSYGLDSQEATRYQVFKGCASVHNHKCEDQGG